MSRRPLGSVSVSNSSGATPPGWSSAARAGAGRRVRQREQRINHGDTEARRNELELCFPLRVSVSPWFVVFRIAGTTWWRGINGIWHSLSVRRQETLAKDARRCTPAKSEKRCRGGSGADPDAAFH